MSLAKGITYAEAPGWARPDLATRSEEGGQDRKKQEVKWGKVEGDGRRMMTGWLKALGLQ